MRDNADLQDRTQQLEHLILQLQSETDTIGKSTSIVALRSCSIVPLRWLYFPLSTATSTTPSTLPGERWLHQTVSPRSIESTSNEWWLSSPRHKKFVSEEIIRIGKVAFGWTESIINEHSSTIWIGRINPSDDTSRCTYRWKRYWVFSWAC